MITKQMFRWHINTQVDNNNINNNYNKNNNDNNNMQ